MKQEMGVVKSRDLQPACETEREARLWLRWSQSEARTRSGWRSIRRERRCLLQHAALTKHVVEIQPKVCRQKKGSSVVVNICFDCNNTGACERL